MELTAGVEAPRAGGAWGRMVPVIAEESART